MPLHMRTAGLQHTLKGAGEPPKRACEQGGVSGDTSPDTAKEGRTPAGRAGQGRRQFSAARRTQPERAGRRARTDLSVVGREGSQTSNPGWEVTIGRSHGFRRKRRACGLDGSARMPLAESSVGTDPSQGRRRSEVRYHSVGVERLTQRDQQKSQAASATSRKGEQSEVVCTQSLTAS